MTRLLAYLAVLLASSLPTVSLAGDNWSIPPEEAMSRFRDGSFEIIEAKRTASGVAGAQKWKIRFDDGKVVKVKWKGAPKYTADGWNNSPMREIAAYEIQKWFLDPADYIVPPSEVRCIPLDVYHAKIDSEARPTVRGTDCVYGVLSLWLQNVEEPPEIWLPELFEQGGYYKFSIAATNVFTYLVWHQDGRPANFLWATDDRHVFSIDNGISFHAFPFNPLVTNWNQMRVPALPKKVVDRLDRVSAEQIRALGVMRELRANDQGILVLVPPGENLGPKKRARTGRGVVQFGLSERDVREVEQRLGDILRWVHTGEIPVF